MRANVARGQLQSIPRQRVNLLRSQRPLEEIGTPPVLIALIRGGLCAGERQQAIPEAPRAERAPARGSLAVEFEHMPRRTAGTLEHYGDTLFLAEIPGGIAVRKSIEHRGQFPGISMETLPPIPIEMKYQGSGAEDLLDATDVLARNAQHHVDQLVQAESLSHQRSHTQVFGFLLGVANGNGFR